MWKADFGSKAARLLGNFSIYKPKQNKSWFFASVSAIHLICFVFPVKKEEDISLSIKEENMCDEIERERQSEADEERDGVMKESRKEAKETDRDDCNATNSSKEVKTDSANSVITNIMNVFMFSNLNILFTVC